MSQSQILLGYSIPEGKEVYIPLAHTAVTGMTQQSGKTTTLEAMVNRSGRTAITFITKRGEAVFSEGRRIRPYFRDRADWQFVTSIIDATLQEKNKFLRPWIMKICQHTKTLAEVQRQVRAQLVKAKGINEGVYTQLDEYLNLIVPEIQRARLAPSLDLAVNQLNVMDISEFATPMQMLFVQSALDHINQFDSSVIVVIPEAWEFIPEGKGSPVKQSAITLVRKGASLHNFIWPDSQDLAGVDKTILRGCTTWIIGVQREANEIKRTLENIPAGVAKPTAEQIATLEKGQFFACWEKHVVKTYVMPVWMRAGEAILVAQLTVRPTQKPTPKKESEDPMWKERAEKAEAEASELRLRMRVLEERLEMLTRSQPSALTSEKPREQMAQAAGVPTSKAAGVPEWAHDFEAMYGTIRDRLLEDAPAILQIALEQPAIEVSVKRNVIQTDGSTLRGRIALLIVDGYFDEPVGGTKVWKELQRRGFNGANNTGRELDGLSELGFLTHEAGEGYKVVSGMKKNIKAVEA